ncbi:hypothetical protein V7Z35_00375 [Candidatus Carsonella ruddii]|uniref:hypothetical protein n=1 Tax=Carsonella ruddii TaxID=114186 RepID=UPI003D81C0C4
MIKNISSINSEFIIINYIYNDFYFSKKILEILEEDDFFFDTTKKFFLQKIFFKIKIFG